MSKQTIASKNINSLLNLLVTYIDSLTVFLKKENKLLSQGDIANASKMLDKKQESLLNFQKIELEIQSSLKKNDIKNNNQATKILEKAKTKYEVLRSLMQENEVLLRSNIEVGEKILEIYNSSRVKDVVSQYGYNKNGKIAAIQNLEKIMPAININNKI